MSRTFFIQAKEAALTPGHLSWSVAIVKVTGLRLEKWPPHVYDVLRQAMIKTTGVPLSRSTLNEGECRCTREQLLCVIEDAMVRFEQLTKEIANADL